MPLMAIWALTFRALMTGWSALDRFLRTDPRDVGCAQAMETLHTSVDLMVRTSKGCGLRRSAGGT